MSKVEEIIDQLKSLTLLEAADLVKQIEETYGQGNVDLETGIFTPVQ